MLGMYMSYSTTTKCKLPDIKYVYICISPNVYMDG